MSSNPALSITPAAAASHLAAEPSASSGSGADPGGKIPVAAAQLEQIAFSSVRLAAIGPQLASLAGRMEAQADTQAKQAEAIATATRALTERLSAVVARLQDASGKVHDVMGEIARIADQTRILSINASIEAARAGEHGRAFAIVAAEVQRLADQTRGSTQSIDERVQAIQGSVVEVAASVRPVAGGEETAAEAALTVQAVNAQVQQMAGATEVQRAGARSLRTLGEQANQSTEELLLTVGRFRLAVHRQAQHDVRALVPVLAKLAGRQQLELALRDWLGRHPAFELLYVTNSGGRQITDNIGWKNGRTWSDSSAVGRDWRDRPWFKEAVRQVPGLVTSDIYRSAATGDFCFTISTVVPDARGLPLGVLGADINFQKMVAADTGDDR